MICVVRALGAWGWRGLSELDCDLGDFGRWGVICVAASVGRVGMGGLSELLFARCQVSKGWSRQRANYGIWGDGV